MPTPSRNEALANACYAHFTQLVAAVAERYHATLHAEGLVIADCYQLTFNYAKACFQVHPTLPQPLYEALRQCYLESFR